ncbi:MAG: cytochrome C oxidase subunit IV family protein [Myxococcaceae bacterium]
MSEPAAAAAPSGDHGHGAGGHAAHPPTNYIRIWGILVVLLVISVAGPFLGIRWLTLITAFGIAIVKAYLVARNFMHINLERRFVVYMVVTMLVLMGIFLGGVSPDVMKHEGARWHNDAADAWVQKGLKEAPPEEGEEHEGHGKPVETGTHVAPEGEKH